LKQQKDNVSFSSYEFDKVLQMPHPVKGPLIQVSLRLLAELPLLRDLQPSNTISSSFTRAKTINSGFIHFFVCMTIPALNIVLTATLVPYDVCDVSQ